MINHANPPAELAVLTTDASINPNPKDVNATKKGIKKSKNMFAIFLVIAFIVWFNYKYGLFRVGPATPQTLRHRINIRERLVRKENMVYPSATRSKDD